MTTKARANPTIWRLAKWLHYTLDETRSSKERFIFNKDDLNESYNDYLYDKALELYSKTGMMSTLGLEE